MKNKKAILKKACGKGGVNVKDVLKEVPGTLFGMSKNLYRAIDPGGILKKYFTYTANNLERSSRMKKEMIDKKYDEAFADMPFNPRIKWEEEQKQKMKERDELKKQKKLEKIKNKLK